MIIFGTRSSNIGRFESKEVSCDYCNQENKQKFSVFGSYAHIFWIPTFPLGKKAFAECTHCKRSLRKSEFSTELKHQYEEHKSSVKRPVWHWSGLLLFGLLVLTLAVFR